MFVVYISGPYSAANEWLVKKNIAKAEDLAVRVWQTGKAAAICPHSNTAHFGNIISHEAFIKGDLEIVERCDAVLMVPGWEDSSGAKQERVFAKSKGIPVFEELSGLFDYLGCWRHSNV